jgi:hypothetical protein
MHCNARQMPGRVEKKPRSRECVELHWPGLFQPWAYRQKKSSTFYVVVSILVFSPIQWKRGLLPWRMFQNSTCLQGESLGIRQDTIQRAIDETADRIRLLSSQSNPLTYIRIKPPLSTPVVEDWGWKAKD